MFLFSCLVMWYSFLNCKNTTEQLHTFRYFVEKLGSICILTFGFYMGVMGLGNINQSTENLLILIFTLVAFIDVMNTWSIFTIANVLPFNFDKFYIYQILVFIFWVLMITITLLLGSLDTSKALILSLFFSLVVQTLSIDFLKFVKLITHSKHPELSEKELDAQKNTFVVTKYFTLVSLFCIAVCEVIVPNKNSLVKPNLFKWILSHTNLSLDDLTNRGAAVLVLSMLLVFAFVSFILLLNYALKWIAPHIIKNN